MASNIPSVNDEAIEHFCSVTGASKSIGHHFMEACDGDMQSAVEMYFDSSSTSVYARPSIHENSNENAGEGTSFQRLGHSNNVDVRAPIPQKKERLVDDNNGFIANMRRRPRPESVFDSFRNFNDEMAVEQSSDDNSAASRRKTLEQLFRPPIDLIFRGSFRAVLDYGASKNKWLIVNVQNVKEFSCQILNRDVWSNPAVKDLIKNRFVFWQVYSDSYEGKWYMQFYKVTSWPQVAILDPRTGEKMLECNKIDAELFCHLAEEFLATHETPNETPFSPSPNKKIRQSDDLLDASEEKQLEAALEASMTNESKSNWNTISYESDEDEDDDESIVSENDEHETIVHHKIIEKNGPTESKEITFEDYLGPSTDAITKLVLRLPNGERRMLEWPCTSKLRALLLYVQENGYNNDDFEIVTNFPREVIDMSNSEKTTLLEAKLHPQQTIFVHLP